jgi:hypothetical protein
MCVHFESFTDFSRQSYVQRDIFGWLLALCIQKLSQIIFLVLEQFAIARVDSAAATEMETGPASHSIRVKCTLGT